MAINKNHEFDDLDGIKCSIVEKNVSAERVEFLKQLLEFNRYTVVVVPSPAPKAAAPAAPKEGETISQPAPAPSTFTIGVTDLKFNPTNAIFGRMLRTKDGHIVTAAYWQQKDSVSNDEIPYFEKE
ncbi:MAG: hypothetical protein IT214_03865 [Chitinophagaceae bacterium]|jgi:hypothetical protein|nr:hypothetical protein [Chitinophagaceae bacterium]OQY95792.1 MAG: hypothetical protein B6D37_04870 [Sphingobacteriales bacterium UTBCD1]